MPGKSLDEAIIGAWRADDTELPFLQVAEIHDFFLSRGDNDHHALVQDRNCTRGAGCGEVAADHREIYIATFQRAGGLDGTIHRLNSQMNF